MIQINNGYEECYYLREDGSIYDADTDKILKPDSKHLYRLKEKGKGYKKVSIRTLYKAIYNKPFCNDTIEDLENGKIVAKPIDFDEYKQSLKKLKWE